MAAHGITPAWAGKSSLPCSRGCSSKDHPRIGGERRMSSCRVGSPPHRRGKAGSPATGSVSPGITPAWAGKSSPAACSAPLRTDHPRMGGEKSFSISSTYCATGSPPRRQGKANWHCVRRPALRITPAQAGKRTRSWRAYGCPWDHPRVGGEKYAALLHDAICVGSPPRWRGKVRAGVRPTAAAGITPALAGKRVGVAVSFQRFKDHPRVGGEKPAVPACCLKFPGSPPRWRGKVVVGIRLVRTPRITPALAGKSGSLCPQDRSRGDHPRVGGEKGEFHFYGQRIGGSPPRWRGKVSTFGVVKVRTGITPALAGKRLKRSHRSGIFISGPIPFHSVLHRPAGSGGSRAGRDGSPAGQPQNAGPA